MRLFAAVAFCALLLPSAAYADTVYNITFTDSAGAAAPQLSATGTFSINVPPSTAMNSVTTYQASGSTTNDVITAFNLTLNGATFTLNSSQYLQFTSGALTDFTYNAATNGATLQVNGLSYLETTNGNLFAFRGTVSAAPASSSAPTVTPEPSSLALLGTGVLGLIGAARRRFV